MSGLCGKYDIDRYNDNEVSEAEKTINNHYFTRVGLNEINDDYLINFSTLVKMVREVISSKKKYVKKVIKHIISGSDEVLYVRESSLSDKGYVNVICGDKSYRSKNISESFKLPYGSDIELIRSSEDSTIGTVKFGFEIFIFEGENGLVPISKPVDPRRLKTHLLWPFSLLLTYIDFGRIRQGISLDTNEMTTNIRNSKILDKKYFMEKNNTK